MQNTISPPLVAFLSVVYITVYNIYIMHVKNDNSFLSFRGVQYNMFVVLPYVIYVVKIKYLI